MTFEKVRERTTSQYSEVFSFLNHIKSLEQTDPTAPQSMDLRIAKGLAYVHMYAAIEKTTNDIVTTALIEVDSIKPTTRHLKSSFQPIAVHPSLQSIRDCSSGKFFNRSANIFEAIEENELCAVNETMFGLYLQNVWIESIDEVCRCFGMKKIAISPLEKSLLNSIVENRNKVAHGRESASEVGQKHSSDHLMRLHDLSVSFCEKLTDEFETFISTRKFVKPHFKKHYIA